MILVVLITALAYATQWYRLSHTVSPDGMAYLELAAGKPVPAPYSRRWLLPRIVGTRWNVWRVVTACALLACSLELWALTHSVWSVWLWLWLPGTAQLMRHPVLVDAVALALAMGAALLVSRGVWGLCGAMVLVIVASCVREPAALFGATFAGQWWLMGGALIAALFLPERSGFERNARSGVAYLDHPFREARKRHDWLNWRTMLLPWGMVVPLFVMGARWDSTTLWACVALALGYGQLLAAQDGPRLFQFGAPAVLIVCVHASLPWWALLAHPFVCALSPEARK